MVYVLVKDISSNAYMQSPVMQDYRQVKQFVQNTEKQVESLDNKLSFAALEAIPTARRISSLPEKFKNNEYLAVAGLAGLAISNLPEDIRDIRLAANQVNCARKGVKFHGSYNYKDYQHSFSFFRGTLLEETIMKNRIKGKEWARRLYDLDKSLYKTKLGEFVEKKLGVIEIDKQLTNITNKMGTKARATKFGGNALQQMTGRAMKRIPLLSVVALALIELPKIFKSHQKGENIFQKTDEVTKQTVKSGINVTALLAGIGYGGAIGSKYGKAFGSLVGMGVGAILGAEGSKKLQEIIG